MNSLHNPSEIRKKFLDFFASKGHSIVPSAPIVVKNDPTLMFTNAGMNQFKDIFLGNAPSKDKRVADTQKCLRVSGKHNDLEEVGIDTYHHTMFEMLGNWSFGDYFKQEAIEWAWELLTKVYELPKDRLYVTVFEGSESENIAFDQEAYDYWSKWISAERIIKGNKKDNFWEMGDTGPCGPCTEIHIDLRPEEERLLQDGKLLVNNDHPQVIEIWNLVFIEFNRKEDGSLQPLPDKHVDTGMGFERLCRAIDAKSSNYDTNVFQPFIKSLSEWSSIPYGKDEKTDIAMRVIADHIRAVSFCIADGQLPSNTGAGYVIRRILRRAVRYGYSFLNFKGAFFHKLVPVLAKQMQDIFPDLNRQTSFVTQVILEEETTFLRTLEKGIQKLNSFQGKEISGETAFELYDTYGFPLDLTELLAREQKMEVDTIGFRKLMDQQKERSRKATEIDSGDWIELGKSDSVHFVGYDETEADVQLLKYRKIKAKGTEQFQLVLDKTPFYAEGGGQVGDTGYLLDKDGNRTLILDTKKENNLIVHFADQLPALDGNLKAVVDKNKRTNTENNHSATHLLHAALRKVLGTHVEQKGSLVNDEYLRFDFSHFSAMTSDQIKETEEIVNEKIRENIPLNEERSMPIEEAKKLGAMALFGEKYGDKVRVICFDKNYSVELCGGTHVKSTGQIAVFKILSESAVAAGVRRIEAVTGSSALSFYQDKLQTIEEIKTLLKSPKDLTRSVQQLLQENAELFKKLEKFENERLAVLKDKLKSGINGVSTINILVEKVDVSSPDSLKQLSFNLKNEIKDLCMVLGSVIEGKPYLAVTISENIIKEKQLNAGIIIKEIAKEIQGGGGGQPFFATAGGSKADGLDAALNKAREIFESSIIK